MFSFLDLELMNWDLWDHVRFPMDEQVIVVSGPNGSGKTTLLDAIRVLLGTKNLSTSRKMSGYLRKEVKVAVLKAVVSNPLRKGHGRRPFARRGIFEDKATIACVLESKSGSWHRRYHILPGDAPLDTIREQGKGMGPEEYSQELRAAGLPRTLLKVLALEQGETHALCRRSPAQLLEYVLEMQGDKAVLDSYEQARENYALSRQDHREQEKKAREAERSLEGTAREARAYEEFCVLQGEVRDIDARRLPAAQWHALQGTIEDINADLATARLKVERFDSENSDRIARMDTLQRELEHLSTAISERKRQRSDLLQSKSSVDGRSREVRMRLKQLVALKAQADSAPDGDIDALRNSARSALLAEADADRRVTEARTKAGEIESELAGLGRTSRVAMPGFVRDMKRALGEAGIEHQLVVDVIDIRKPKWQKAVESVLGRDRFTVLVDSKDALAARKLASSKRYPAYVASLESAVVISAPKHSALGVVELSEPRTPAWLIRRLADITLVESVEDGFGAGGKGPTMTVEGYRQDKRGGVYVGVEDLYCGASAGTARRSRLLEDLAGLTKRAREMEESLRASSKRRAVAENELEAVDARSRWAEAKEEYETLAVEDATLIDQKRERSQAIMDVLNETDEMAKGLAERESELARIRRDGALVDEERRRRLVRQHELSTRLHRLMVQATELLTQVPEELRTEAAGTLLETEGELRGRLTVLREREERYDGCKDPTIVDQMARKLAHLDEQLALLRQRGNELRSGEDELARARRSYIRVADATIGRYAKGLTDLGRRAGMDVEVRRPRLTEDDEMLSQAGLEVRLGFDGKHPVRIGDPRLSGGQKVLASILLLVALTYEGEQSGGFFILDEPFAHLSVERIDHVANFIGKTGSQFLLTTPTTHNFAVFNAAQLLLTLRKKAPDMDAAPAPMFLRR
jgi:chromosome segregation ATPase